MGENDNYHQVGNAYLQYDEIFRKVALAPANEGDPPNPPDPDFIKDDNIRLVNNAFAATIKQVRLATTEGADYKENKYVGSLATMMLILTNKAGDLL